MECISVFDMLKIGVGPSSSHTLGPWRAANRFIDVLHEQEVFHSTIKVTIDLFGSLSLTGKGHATDIAVIMGLCHFDPTSFPTDKIQNIVDGVKNKKALHLGSQFEIPFVWDEDLKFNREFHPFHPNAMTFKAYLDDGEIIEESYFSIGGGFVVQEDRHRKAMKQELFASFPYPVQKGKELLELCKKHDMKVHELVMENERSLRSDIEISGKLDGVWEVMLQSIFDGCHTEGILPGGLNVQRRAYDKYQKLKGELPYNSPEEWMESIRQTKVAFREILKWVSCYALAVNEVNAALGRIVTAPTNGSAGVIPAVLLYYLTIENHAGGKEHIHEFLLVAGEIGSLFKKGATISAAMGGCQAEIGVSSAMAAAGLTSLLGGSSDQVLMAAEIAMEHHLGMTCDPIAGLVQVPCIERNAMGAIKAINAAELALDSDPGKAKVTLDGVIQTMWETAQDMNTKYKETSEGGLAVQVAVSDC